jgi:hypothetical protein
MRKRPYLCVKAVRAISAVGASVRRLGCHLNQAEAIAYSANVVSSTCAITLQGGRLNRYRSSARVLMYV